MTGSEPVDAQPVEPLTAEEALREAIRDVRYGPGLDLMRDAKVARWQQALDAARAGDGLGAEKFARAMHARYVGCSDGGGADAHDWRWHIASARDVLNEVRNPFFSIEPSHE